MESPLPASALGPGTAPPTSPRGTHRAPGSADTAHRELCTVTQSPELPPFLYVPPQHRDALCRAQPPAAATFPPAHGEAPFCFIPPDGITAIVGSRARIWVSLDASAFSAALCHRRGSISSQGRTCHCQQTPLHVWGCRSCSPDLARALQSGCRAPFWMLVLRTGLYGSSPARHCHVHSAGRSSRGGPVPQHCLQMVELQSILSSAHCTQSCPLSPRAAAQRDCAQWDGGTHTPVWAISPSSSFKASPCIPLPSKSSPRGCTPPPALHCTGSARELLSSSGRPSIFLHNTTSHSADTARPTGVCVCVCV